MDEATSKNFLTNYSILIKDLIQRYFRVKEATAMVEAGTTDQVEKLREEVSQIKEMYKESKEAEKKPRITAAWSAALSGATSKTKTNTARDP